MVRSIAVVWAMACAQASFAADVAIPPPQATPQAVPGYVSSLADYKAWREPALTPWRRLNDEVAKLGGHMGHMRAAPTPGAADPAKPSEAPGAKR